MDGLYFAICYVRCCNNVNWGLMLTRILPYSPDVEFCAYSIPHPSEDKMNVRIQTYGMLHTPLH